MIVMKYMSLKNQWWIKQRITLNHSQVSTNTVHKPTDNKQAKKRSHISKNYLKENSWLKKTLNTMKDCRNTGKTC
jgi:uncharacterized membrane protein YcgQ (UPF0703/DUF1980 family)